ncbi:hypothetical protein QMK17_13400 [Rhodococcus sp. G-MC3]|uniref:hypothetical protein n=1 Tax=Rhodococcus sp. G-MC3 TaxID=3046209 RepID=UPI0024B88F28|nr:hypothetical protein [Rhodococcus sp. G-MC3]MDJ0394323.1 hypothetical protein [Rhodococcus sp. G-MC3]
MSSLRSIALSAAVLTGVVLSLSACGGDGQQGIPTETTPAPTTQNTSTQSTSTQSSTTAAQSPTTTLTPPPGPAVGDVPGNPQATSALRAFVTDLQAGGVPAVTPPCWTVPPSEIALQYADVPSILDAAAAPGVDGQYAVTWTGPVSTVSIKRSDITSGYACPRIYPTGTAPAYSDVDAEYTVERYLGRFTGAPVNPDDLEGDYPLVCENRAIWDPQGTGAPTAPPLANNPGRLTGSASYNPESVYVASTDGVYKTVYADVTNVSGFEQNQVFTLTIAANGYCIGDVA